MFSLSLSFKVPSNKFNIRKSLFNSSRLFATATNFYGVTVEELKGIMKDWEQPTFRVGQIRSWVYDKGIDDFSKMENIPIALREKLMENYCMGDLTLADEKISKDGTIKRAYALHDGQLIESVLMPYDDGRNTACISSQAGCAMGCIFCATGNIDIRIYDSN